MRVFYHYQYAQPNSGIQLRVDFDQYNTGYASYFPWTNLDQPHITNVINELKEIGKLWKYPGKAPKLPVYKTPIVASNLAKSQKMNSSWAMDVFISDYANNDDFWGKSWIPSPLNKKEHFLEVVFDEPTDINSAGFVELYGWYRGYKGYDSDKKFKTYLKSYKLKLFRDNKWIEIPIKQKSERIRIHKFKKQKVEKVRFEFIDFGEYFGVSEVLVYKNSQ